MNIHIDLNNCNLKFFELQTIGLGFSFKSEPIQTIMQSNCSISLIVNCTTWFHIHVNAHTHQNQPIWIYS